MCVARAAGKPTPFLGYELPNSQLEKPPVPCGAGCELPYSQMEISALAKLCPPSGPSRHRLEPQLWGSGQIPVLEFVQPCSCFSCCRTRILRSAGAPHAPELPSSPLSVLELVVESSFVPGFGLRTRGAVVFPHPKPTPTQAAWLWLRNGGRAGMFVPLFLGKEHEQLC